jgi:putative SOS response-associated peptidase YedK
MCGRMSLSRRELLELADELEALPVAGAAALYRPRYNVAPTDRHPIVSLERGRRRLEMAGWGFVRGRGQPPLFNARSETAPVKDSFRAAFAGGRCLVPADGFFEWAGAGERRRPFWLHPADGKLLLFAGLCELAPPGDGGGRRFSVLTTAASEEVARLHHRMPVILAPADVDRWLRSGDPELLRPAAEGVLRVAPVSTRVNSVRHDDPACLDPPAPEPPSASSRQLDLF